MPLPVRGENSIECTGPEVAALSKDQARHAPAPLLDRRNLRNQPPPAAVTSYQH
jgi:hypothetical protein